MTCIERTYRRRHRDLYALYQARTRGGAPELPAIATLTARHARAEADWLTTADAERQRAFWRGELAELPAPLELPGDRPRGARRSYRGAKVNFTLPEQSAQSVRALAAEESTTPFVVVLTAFSVLLAALSDQKDPFVGCAVSGRHRPETRDLIGNFVNTLPIRSRISAGQSFRSLLRDTARRVNGAMDHQEPPFEGMARDAVRGEASTVFQVLFNLLHPGSMSPRPPVGVAVRPLPFERTTTLRDELAKLKREHTDARRKQAEAIRDLEEINKIYTNQIQVLALRNCRRSRNSPPEAVSVT
ncbi:condensation domain-containing protein [Streptomyces sp. NPDC127074]|uniref:condensation domain-containing protein n=1 Tax=Streptomyces sp. NPDC127074 TaxID=3347130 RepID=UPI0036582F5E